MIVRSHFTDEFSRELRQGAVLWFRNMPSQDRQNPLYFTFQPNAL